MMSLRNYMYVMVWNQIEEGLALQTTESLLDRNIISEVQLTASGIVF